MHPYETAAVAPDRSAFICADSGAALTYGELDAQSNQAAQLFRSLGLRKGDVVALLAKNGPVFAVAYWACQRSGLMLTPVSTHLKVDEVAYILRDCGAKVLITAPDASEAAAQVSAQRETLVPGLTAVFTVGADLEGASSWTAALAGQPARRIPDECSGYYLVYSGGSTGRPKGVVLPFESGSIEQLAPMEAMSLARAAPIDGPSVSMTPAPLYHAAPLFTMITAHRKGDTLVVLERFDAVQVLKAIETYKVAAIQVVPTMFVRLLALPEAERSAYDLSSLQRVTHAAAPCPVSVKHKMIQWLGPIIYEYYSGSEANGQCSITPEEWLRKPGSVGRATWGVLHICDEAGRELPAGEAGLVYFEGAQAFSYRNDPEKTSKSLHPQHATWSTLGDIGYVDDEGYLFLCDRKDFMIISGGVNIYPQAVEDLLVDHPKVFDAAVIGVPNDAFGEEVKAVVQPLDWSDAGKELEAELIAHCRRHVSKLSCPRSIDFVRTLPRLPTGKLAKHEIRRPYWPDGRAIAGEPVFSKDRGAG
jgi:acyl-CoA synthetase (AMP-forming)/AMP-acid ligase II